MEVVETPRFPTPVLLLVKHVHSVPNASLVPGSIT